MSRIIQRIVRAVLATFAAVGFAAGGVAPAAAAGERFVLISHAPDSDSWWNTIKNAIGIAGGQMGAIARAVYFGAKVLILDEPTSALGVRQTSTVLKYISMVRGKGLGVVFITHNVRHAAAVGDRFPVLNRGRTLGTAVRGEITQDELQNLMAAGRSSSSWRPSSVAPYGAAE